MLWTYYTLEYKIFKGIGYSKEQYQTFLEQYQSTYGNILCSLFREDCLMSIVITLKIHAKTYCWILIQYFYVFVGPIRYIQEEGHLFQHFILASYIISICMGLIL